MYLPHWMINGQRTSSQFDAWRYASKLGIKPDFHFFDEEFSQLDWTKEPEENWDQICYERCILLRQKYKKLSLFYSAGRDSHHILKCFFFFKIPLDEIVLLNLRTNKMRQDELIRLIYPHVHDFIRVYPETKVTTVDVGPKEFDEYFKEDWLEQKASALVHGYFQPTNFSFYVKHILHDDQPNHGVILGVDKPRIILENGKYYSTIIDKTMETFITDIPNIELFYYSPDYPKIHLKQNWLLLNHIESNYEKSKITPEFLLEYCGNSHSVYYDDFCIACGRGKAWNVNLGIQNGKSKYKNNGKEKVFLDLINYAKEENWVSVYNFTEALSYLKTCFPGILNNEDPYMGTLGVYSKKYYMKDQ